ncbi:uncharacterized protein LOC111677368 [Lucilia cuprina]|uniref:uncharacterized protein LOC111677368 n=1 Tax=Lucilia cuprina TaxID=7375 RepID=UPI001F068AB7|nr:uncharacterized protein LOC111677368 [Lucilia cuprina]XP_046811961.1 uncharacterized protein LOC111677368 [Lucilia cuprina]
MLITSSLRPRSQSASKMPVLSLRNVAITFSMSSVVNCKMLFIYIVFILSNCMSWSATGGGGASVLASSISEPKAKSAFLHAGDITETHKLSASSSSTPTITTTPATAALASNSAATSSVSPVKPDFVLPPLGAAGGGVSGSVGAAATGSASSRFNVDLRRSSVSSTGAIQSPTTFIGSNVGSSAAVGGHNHHQIRRKPQQLSASSSSSSLSATKSAFDEKSKFLLIFFFVFLCSSQ